MKLLIMVCGIPMISLLSLLDISMLTRPKMLRIEKAYLVLVSLSMIILWLGLVRNKTLYLYQLSKLNIL